MLHQFLLHWIGVHVVEFLFCFFLAVNIEIIKPALPETPQFRSFLRTLTSNLFIGCAAGFPPQFSGYPLFKDLQNSRRSQTPRFAHQQVHMLRHHHVTENLKLVSFPNFTQDLHEQIPFRCRRKKLPPLVTTKGNKMEVAPARVPLGFNSQQEKQSPPFLGRKDGAPSYQYSSHN